jgi:hypothetical protein
MLLARLPFRVNYRCKVNISNKNIRHSIMSINKSDKAKKGDIKSCRGKNTDATDAVNDTSDAAAVAERGESALATTTSSSC